MTAPQRTTPNPGTVERPERSSRRIARKSPLGWLPWALLGALAALLALTLLVINALDDDGPEGAAGDSLGQVSGENGDSAIGSDGGSGEGSTDGESGTDGDAGADTDGGSATGGGTGGSGAGGDALAALSQTALVGGASVQPAAAAQVPGAQALASQAGTAGTVLFVEGSAEIDAGGREVLSAAATALRDAGARSVQVVGHTDVVAGDPVNDTLSQERADAVAAALGQDLPGVQITTAARSDDEPVASNDDEAGRQLNRRAVITATG